MVFAFVFDSFYYDVFFWVAKIFPILHHIGSYKKKITVETIFCRQVIMVCLRNNLLQTIVFEFEQHTLYRLRISMHELFWLNKTSQGPNESNQTIAKICVTMTSNTLFCHVKTLSHLQKRTQKVLTTCN